jgi:hypothetical protein
LDVVIFVTLNGVASSKIILNFLKIVFASAYINFC